jgi:hypothetical protein
MLMPVELDAWAANLNRDQEKTVRSSQKESSSSSRAKRFSVFEQ